MLAPSEVPPETKMNKIQIRPLFPLLFSLGLLLLLSGCGYNELQRGDEQIKAAWSEVINQYQRRADLVPNLVNTVKGFAQQEREVIASVTEARARLAGARTRPEQIDAAREVDSALARLLVVVENYPQLKSDAQFTRLMDELAGTENRIAVERMRYNELVANYNIRIQQMPTNVVASVGGFQPEPPFTAAPGARDVPTVDFSRSPAPAVPAASPAK